MAHHKWSDVRLSNTISATAQIYADLFGKLPLYLMNVFILQINLHDLRIGVSELEYTNMGHGRHSTGVRRRDVASW